jgi:hypothetical protein
MKTLPVILTLMTSMACLSQTVYAQKDLPVDDASTAAFIELCKNPNDEQGRSFCFGFGEGVYQAYLVNRSPNAKPTICFTNKSETRNEILQKFLAWNAVNPQFSQERAAKTLMRFFTKNYSCNQN